MGAWRRVLGEFRALSLAASCIFSVRQARGASSQSQRRAACLAPILAPGPIPSLAAGTTQATRLWPCPRTCREGSYTTRRCPACATSW